MSRMVSRVIRLVGCVLLLAACSSDGEANVQQESEEPLAAPSARVRVRQIDWDFAVSSEGGTLLHVNFVGGRPGDLESDPCAVDYEVEAIESKTGIRINVWELGPTDNSQLPSSYSCTDVGHSWSVGVLLDDLIGDRRVSGSAAEQGEVPSVDDLLVPTRLPEGWSWTYGETMTPEIILGYGGGSPGGQQPLVVYIVPETPAAPVIDEAARIEGSTPVSVRSTNDGAIATRSSGATVLAFAHSGWAYRVDAGRGVDEVVVRDFVANMRTLDELDDSGFSAGMEAPANAASPLPFGSGALDARSHLSSRGWPAARAPVVEPAQPPMLRRSVPAGVDWDAAFTSGRTVTVTFTGGSPGDLANNPCAMDYQLRTNETAEEVGIAIDVTGRQEGAECTSEGYTWALTTTLEEPLGERRLVSRRSGAERDTVQIETRLEPTWLPEEFSLLQGGHYLPRRSLGYGDVDDPQEFLIRVSISPILLNPRLHGLRQLDDFEQITIRRDGDGIVATEFDGSFTVGFEEQGWYYRISGAAGVDRETLIEIARSFERPALFDREALPDRLTVPFFEPEPQAGQG